MIEIPENSLGEINEMDSDDIGEISDDEYDPNYNSRQRLVNQNFQSRK